MIVTFCGNKDVVEKEVVVSKLDKTIENLIAEGATKFLLGGYGEFDILAAQSVKILKKKRIIDLTNI